MKPEVPETLRQKVVGDLRPVKPVAPPPVRLVLIILWSCALLVAVPALMGLRFNAPNLGFWLLWGATGVEAIAGGLLVLLALREAIPGLGASWSTLVVALLGALVLELGIALFTYARCPCPASGIAIGVPCFSNEILLGLSALGLTLFLVVRAYPLSPPKAGLLGGVGAGLIADAVQHTICPVSDLRHVLVTHLGAVGLLGVVGLVLGIGWQSIRLWRLRKELSGDK
ncbi:MAG: NrsF family protein [Thermoanaerobaculaceae bacterium]